MAAWPLRAEQVPGCPLCDSGPPFWESEPHLPAAWSAPLPGKASQSLVVTIPVGPLGFSSPATASSGHSLGQPFSLGSLDFLDEDRIVVYLPSGWTNAPQAWRRW